MIVIVISYLFPNYIIYLSISINRIFIPCSKTLISLGSYPFSTRLDPSHYKFGISQVPFLFNKVHNGHIKRLTDQDIQSSVLEIMGTNVTTAYITCPANEK